MRSFEHSIIVGIIAVGVFHIGSAPAADDAALRMCVSCHGEDGRGTEADVPIISGIPAVVQEDALFAYLDGDRTCVTKPMMCKITERLSEEQITTLSGHYASMPFAPADEEFDAALAERGKALHQRGCAICHGSDDSGDGESSILHGQRKVYLRLALQQYVAGERTQLPAMEKKVADLTGDDIEALVEYYASYRN